MTPLSSCAAFLSLALQSPEAPADLTPRFELPDGLGATLYAESPHLYNPTAIDVDERGRVWVAEAVNYRQWRGRNPGRHHEGGDRIVILEDTDHDGAADSSKVFVQDEDLVAPLGLTVLGDKVLVACSPNIFVYTDTDGDDVADEREVFLTGFGGRDHDHGVHSIVVGPDGAYYGNAGNAGPHLVTDRSGFSMRSGSLYRGGGETAADNKPALTSDDGRVWTGGLVYSIEPDGTGLAVLAHNFRNNYEVALDSFGELYQSDNDDDGNASCRTMWVLRGGNYGFFSADGSRSWQADRRPGQPTPAAHWHADDPGVMPPGTINGAGGPTGVCVYEGDLLDHHIGGAVLNADAGRNVVYAHRPSLKGAGIELERSVLIQPVRSADPERSGWFRPSDVAVQIDGSVLVADWYDPGVGGHAAGDREAYGRIIRISPKDAAPTRVGYDWSTDEGLVEALASPAVHVRAKAFRALEARGEAALPALRKLVTSTQIDAARVRAMWLLAKLPAARAEVRAQLRAHDPRWRVAAFRAVLRESPEELLELAEDLVEDPSPHVRATIAAALRDVAFEDCEHLLVQLAESFDGADRSYLEAFGLAADGKEEETFAALAAELGDTPAKWDERFAALAWRLHPESAIPAFEARAMDPTLSAEAREDAVTALAFAPSRAAGEAMLNVALAGPPDSRSLALFWIDHRDSNDWREYGLKKAIRIGGLEDAELVFESDVVREGVVPIDVDVRGGERLWLVVGDAGNGYSCDWADWLEPRFVGPEGATKLSDLRWLEASTGWGDVHVGRNANGGPLMVDDKRYADGIGTHADSTIAFPIPPGAERFQCLGGADAGGTRQGCGTSVVFRVYVERAPDRGPLLARMRTVLDDGATPGARREAALELAGDAEGGRILVGLAAEERLGDQLRTAVADELFRNPDLGVRALASEHFPRPGGESLPPVGALLALDGDPHRGRLVFLSERAQCSSCHRFEGRGGDIGPDLTDVRTKYERGAVLDAIVNPSAAITHGFDTYIVQTHDLITYTGFLLADGLNVVLKDTQGMRHVIPADEVAIKKKLERSTMPDGVALGLAPQEIADLLAMLTANAGDRSYGEWVELFNGRDLEGWTHHLSKRSVSRDEVWSVEDGVLICKGRPSGYIRTTADYESFELSLEWRFDPEAGPGNSGVLLRMVGTDKVWPKSIEAQLQHRNAGDIWNINRFPMHVAEDRTRGRRTVKSQPSNERPLGEWNHYEITVDGGNLELKVNGAVQNTATWCEVVPGKICLQSEGAKIEFRNIRLRPILR